MLPSYIRRVLKSGFISFWRDRFVASASILVLVVTLFTIGSLFLANAFLENTLEQVKDQVDISVAFRTDASEGEILELKRDLESLDEVREVEYSSREEELASFQERYRDDELIIRSLEEIGNPLGARLQVTAVDPDHYPSIAAFLNDRAGGGDGAIIERVNFKQDIVDRLMSIISTSRTVGVAIALLLIFVSVLVTFNTISLAIYVSRDEISVMRLVGAGNWYIRGPFMVSGMLSGVIASLVALILLYPATIWVTDTTVGVYGGVNLFAYYQDQFGVLFLILLGSGIVLGLISSFLAIRKYLKV